MDKKIAGLIGAVSAFATLDAASAAAVAHAQDVMTVASYDDLLKPIPNATAVLQTSDALAQTAVEPEAKVELAQYYYHHHHHHHHRFFRPFYHHHHHRYYRHHHHHHHHHHHYRYEY